MYELMNVYLENGLKVVLHRLPLAKTIACGVWIRQGSKYEDSKTSGLSHLLEHISITANSASNKSDTLDKISEYGIVYNATTYKEYTSYKMTSISENMELCISTLSKIVTEYREVPDDVFENEKEIVRIEAMGYYSSFKQIAERCSQALWGNTDIGRIIVGDVDNINLATQENIYDLYRNGYTPANSTLVMVGGFEYEEALQIISKYFIGWKDRVSNNMGYSVNNETGIYINTQNGGESSIVSLCFKMLGFESKYRNDIEVLSLILGDSGVKSRLAKEIRMKRGLAYIVNSFESFYEERGMLGFASVCKSKNVDEILDIMIKELIRSRDYGFELSEIEAAKNKLITKRILCLENITEHLKFLGKCATYNYNYSLEQEIRNIKNIAPKSIMETANKVLNDTNMGFAAIGDFNSEELIKKVRLA